MKKIFLDTETTDLKPGQVCQLSYIIEDAGELTGRNYFFRVDRMSEGAQAVHGFTLEYLSQFGRFADSAAAIERDLAGSLIICHNAYFDMGYLRTEFGRCGRAFEHPSFCTMRHFTNICRIPGPYGWKWPKLEELMPMLEINAPGAVELELKLYGWGAKAHDSRFDTAGLYLCYTEGVKLGYIREERRAVG